MGIGGDGATGGEPGEPAGGGSSSRMEKLPHLVQNLRRVLEGVQEAGPCPSEASWSSTDMRSRGRVEVPPARGSIILIFFKENHLEREQKEAAETRSAVVLDQDALLLYISIVPPLE